MLCDACHKNEATVHLTEIINDKVTKLNLCEACARAKGAEMEEHFGLSDLLAGLSDIGTSAQPHTEDMAKCGECGLTYKDFRKAGRFGCGNCYEAFKAQIAPLLKRIHGADRHVGKVPVITGGKTVRDTRTLQELKVNMEKAISMEEFEEAAKLRDRIRELEKNQRGQKGKEGA